EWKIASTHAIEQILDRDDDEVAFLPIQLELEESCGRDLIDSRDGHGRGDQPEVKIAAFVDDSEGCRAMQNDGGAACERGERRIRPKKIRSERAESTDPFRLVAHRIANRCRT